MASASPWDLAAYWPEKAAEVPLVNGARRPSSNLGGGLQQLLLCAIDCEILYGMTALNMLKGPLLPNGKVRAMKVTKCIVCGKEIFYKTKRPKRCPKCREEYRRLYKRLWYKQRKQVRKREIQSVLGSKELRVALRLDVDHFIGKGTHYFTNLKKIWVKEDGVWRIKSAWDLEEWIRGKRRDFRSYFD